MRLCSDPRLTYLNDLGYSVVRAPRAGLVPLGVIGVDPKSKQWLGTLDQIWATSAAVPAGPALPALRPAQAMVDLSGASTGNIEVSFGLDILANALKGLLGGAAPSLEATYKDAKTLQFTFGDVRSIGVDPLAVGAYLRQRQPDGSNPFVKRYLLAGNGAKALLITETLEASSISVTAKREDGTTVGIGVPALPAGVAAKLKVTVGGRDEHELTYQGKTVPVVFGFKAHRLVFNGEVWEVDGVDPSAVSFSPFEEAIAEPTVLGGLVEFDGLE